MNNEEIQKTMEFIVRQQEVFSGNMERAEARMSPLETAFIGLFNVVNETAKAQKELAERQKELTEAQRQTDERLNVLINTVERFISEGGNGRREG